MSSGNIPSHGPTQPPVSPALSEAIPEAQKRSIPDKEKQDFSNLLKGKASSSSKPANIGDENLLSSSPKHKHSIKDTSDLKKGAENASGKSMANVRSGSGEETVLAEEQDAERFDAKLSSESQPMVLNVATQANEVNIIKAMQNMQAATDVDAIMKQVAKQIQVSAADAVNGAEVRITLKDNILAGTEIRIQRHGGELTVMMNTTSAESGQLLVQNQAALQKLLAERFNQEQVQVNVNVMSEEGSSDGRSRNEYFGLDDDEQSPFNN